MTHITRPGEGPALRVVTSHTATPEQRQAAHDHLAAMAADDLLWAAPGTRPLTDAERYSIGMGRQPPPYDQWAWIDDNRGARMLGWVTAGVLVAGSITAMCVTGWLTGQWWGLW